MPEHEIQVRYDELELISRRFEQQGLLVRKLSQKLCRFADDLEHSGWQGNGASAFQMEFHDDILPALNRLILSLEAAGEGTIQIIQIFQRAEGEGSASNMVDTASSITLPSSDISARDIFDFINEWSTPLDWIGDNKGASKIYHGYMQELGRYLNKLFNTRGYIKKLDAIASLTEGVADGIAVIGNLVSLRDFYLYFNGHMTNAEIAKTAITTLIPIPVLGAKIADWMISNMSDPDGKWRGLVPKAYSI